MQPDLILSPHDSRFPSSSRVRVLRYVCVCVCVCVLCVCVSKKRGRGWASSNVYVHMQNTGEKEDAQWRGRMGEKMRTSGVIIRMTERNSLCEGSIFKRATKPSQDISCTRRVERRFSYFYVYCDVGTNFWPLRGHKDSHVQSSRIFIRKKSFEVVHPKRLDWKCFFWLLNKNRGIKRSRFVAAMLASEKS